MKKYALVLLMALVFCTASAQQPENQGPAATLQQSKQLEEALRLTTSAVNLFAKGKFDEAASPAKRALEIREKILTPDDRLVVAAVLNLAEIQWARERTPEAKLLFERALQSYERMSGVEDANLIKVLGRLALVHYRMGRPDETEKSYKRALAVGEKSFGVESPGTGSLIFNLAEFYQLEGEYKKAGPLYQRLVAIREKSKAGEASIAEARERYACVLRKTKRFQEADELEGRVPGVNIPMGTRGSLEGGVVNGRAIHLVQPPYPQEARVRGVSGKVTVQVLIDETGRVIRVCAIEGPGLLIQAAESAARRSRFTATLLSGTPVKVNGVIIYNFQ